MNVRIRQQIQQNQPILIQFSSVRTNSIRNSGKRSHNYRSVLKAEI